MPNNDLNGAIRLSVKGREPGGLVQPGAEYDKLLDWLTQRLGELVNPATGKPAIQKVSRIHEIYDGPHLDALPDLTALWAGEAPIDEVYSPGYGTVSGSHNDLRTGGHAAEGFLLLKSASARLGDTAGADAKCIAPTVLDLLGVAVPESMEGHSLVVRTSTRA